MCGISRRRRRKLRDETPMTRSDERVTPPREEVITMTKREIENLVSVLMAVFGLSFGQACMIVVLVQTR